MTRRMYLKCLLLATFSFSFIRCSEDDDLDDEEETGGETLEITPDEGMDLYGFIGDNDGNPIANVVVSDGFACTVTDEDGIYQMARNENAKFVFYSTPSGYAVNTASESVRVASFYSELYSAVERYDFTLEKLAEEETNFTLICIGDPQTTSSDTVSRFEAETMADLKTFTAEESLPCYALSLGDVVGDKPALLGQMKVLLGSATMTSFTTIGNHDKVETSDETDPRTADAFEDVFGPLDYSFNRGKVHFVCLDNIIYSDSDEYTAGLSNSQIAWLKEDLSYVSKDRMVIVYYHIPFRAKSSYANRAKMLSALSGFAEVHLMCGHTHYTENYLQTSPISCYEHIHGAACGAWWKSTINGDGTPNGYAVYNVKGNTFDSWYYKPTNLSDDFQIRLHKGNISFGGAFGHYSFDLGENTIAVNVWNADDDWTIEAYEDGVKVATLSQQPTSSHDAWAMGYHIGVLNRNSESYDQPCKHLFKHTMVNPDASLEIKATDPFGNVYTQSEIIADLTTAESY